MSTVPWALVDCGWIFLMLRDYRAVRVLVGTFAQKLDVSISKAIDLLARFGICLPLEYEDHLEGLEPVFESRRAFANVSGSFGRV